jgi:Xaa-Pro aminopeptidase
MKQIFILLVIIFSIACNKIVNVKELQTASPVITSSGPEGNQRNFLGRRHRLSEKAGKGIIILQSDNGYSGGRHEYKPDNNFYYLSGFKVPGSLLLIDSDGLFPYTMFITEKTINQIVYTGALPGIDEIMNTYLADTVLHYGELDKIIKESINAGLPLYFDPTDLNIKEYLIGMAGKKDIGKLMRNVNSLIDEMRVNKDDFEISSLQKAIDITGEAFINACRTCKPGMNEFETEAVIEYTFRKNGSSMPAFESIVGSGSNAVSLHYSDNDRKMEDGDLLLMDTGAEYDSYCADITRTIPVNGKFSREQKEIYQLVLNSQKAAIAAMTPGKPFLSGHNESTKIIIRGLYELGLITDTNRLWQKKFYLHYPITHYLGMDVHDVGDYGVSRRVINQYLAKDTTYGRILEKGMVVTVEPGLYFRANGMSQLNELYGEEATGEEISDFIKKVTPVYEKYKNIGIRIEDDILITEKGNINMSENIPKEIGEIENFMKKRVPAIAVD